MLLMLKWNAELKVNNAIQIRAIGFELKYFNGRQMSVAKMQINIH